MGAVLEQRGLRFLPAPDSPYHPSIARMRALRDAVRREKPDLLHVWDWPQCLDAYYGEHLIQRVPMVVSHMSMEHDSLLPLGLPTTFGTPELVDSARLAGRRYVDLLLPPVDVEANAPGVVDGKEFRREHGLGDEEIVIVTVSRVVKWMKAESLHRTIEAVRELGRTLPLRFVVVGDGHARDALQSAAGAVNEALGREVIILVGALLDPRPAYAAADIVVGMGGSALRGMAFAKPVVIVGERGFSAPFTPETAKDFYYKGMYGLGDGNPGNADLLSAIRHLAENRRTLASLGEFSREFVLQHFSLDTVSARFAGFCRNVLERPSSFVSAAVDGLRTAAYTLAGTVMSPRQ